SVLPFAAGLLDVFAIRFSFAANGFAVGDLRTPHIGIHAEFTLHAVNDDFQVKFAHAGNDGLASFRVGVHAKGGIFLRKPRQCLAHFVLIGFGLGSAATSMTGARKVMASRT